MKVLVKLISYWSREILGQDLISGPEGPDVVCLELCALNVGTATVTHSKYHCKL